jgi:chemotaxis protein CheX
MPTAPASRFGVSSQLIITFVNVVRTTLLATARWESVTEKPRLKADLGSEYDVSGIISLSGTYVGTVVISFHQDTAVKLATAMLQCESAPSTADICDAVGEMANMIAGGAKNEFGGPDTTISIPSVVMGKGHIISRPSEVPCILVPCKTLHGDFAVEVCIKVLKDDKGK